MPEREPSMPYDPQALRQQAEEAAAAQAAAAELPPPEELPRLVHELQVHQIELKMQNAALRDAQAELEVLRDRYADLFDFAPVGYITLDEAGAVCEINLTACTMLGVERKRVHGKRLAAHVPPEVKARFLEYLRACRNAEPGEELTGEFLLGEAPAGELTVLVRTGVATDPHTTRRQYRLVLTDMSARKRAEDGLRALNETLEQRVAERTAAVELLCDVASAANRAQTLGEALDYCLERMTAYTGWQFSHAWLPDADDPDLLMCARSRYAAGEKHAGTHDQWALQKPLRRGECLPGRVYATGESHWVADVSTGLQAPRAERARQLGLVAVAAFPIMAENRTVGVLEFFSANPISLNPQTLTLLAGTGAQLGRVIERKVFQDRLLTLSEDEHRRIGQELHDDVGQELTGLALQVETLMEILDEPDDGVRKLAGRISTAIARIRRKTRNLSRGLVPMEIDAPALESALEALATEVNECNAATCTFGSRGEARVAGRRTATQLYRIAQEAVANALKHAGARRIDIELDGDRLATVLEVRDDGRGLPPPNVRCLGTGLDIMRHRAELIGATLTVESAPTGGTRVRCEVPG